jgi:hypothetical protein
VVKIPVLVFWDATLCGLEGTYQSSGGTICLHLQPCGSMFPQTFVSTYKSTHIITLKTRIDKPSPVLKLLQIVLSLICLIT